MADRGNRGNRGGGPRGGGPRGGRGQGGRGGPPSTRGGDRGGWGGGDRGGRGGGYSAGRGSEPRDGQGDGSYAPRGRGRGGFQGGFGGPGRGSGPDCGRGDFRGRGDSRGRGRGRGGRGGFSGPSVFNYDGFVPEPDKNVTELEGQIVDRQTSEMQELVSQMGKLKMGAKAKPSTLSGDLFPLRPAYGTYGTPVTLWANYYQVTAKLGSLYTYTMEVSQVFPEGEAKGKSKPKGPAEPRTKEVKGRKLYFVIREVLAELSKADSKLILATEFKSKLVSLCKINFPDNPLNLSIPSPNDPEKQETFTVAFHGPTEASVDNMMKSITSSAPEPASEAKEFPKFQTAIDALNVIFGFGPRSRDEISAVGSSRFFLFKNGGVAADLTQRNRPLQAVRGYFQSSRLGTGRLLLNTNVTHGVFKLSGKVEDIFHNLGVRASPRRDYRATKMLRLFSKFLPKTRVWVEMTLSNGKKIRRTKAIHSLATSSELRRSRATNPPRFDADWEFAGPKNVQFWMDTKDAESRWISVFEYYKQKYNVTLADYPLLNLGSADRPTYFPAEFVEIQPGQSVKAKLLSEETVAMLNFACRSPYANAFSITNDGRETLGLDDGSLDRFGISVGKHLLTVQGRVLSCPEVTYMHKKMAQPCQLKPEGASWNLRDVKIFKAGSRINRWTYVNVTPQGFNPVAQDVVNKFAQFMSGMGININTTLQAPPTEQITYHRDTLDGGYLDKFFQWATENKMEFILVILGTKDADIYNKIKTLGDCVYGIHTSCVQGGFKLFGGGSPGYFANVALKWNLKTGGVNHKLTEELELTKQGRTMVVGYDVTHPTNMPSGKSDDIPSLVGLVSSIDRDMGQWPSVSWEQNSKQEMLGQQLVDAFKSRLHLWQKRNKNFLPENIVIFRDGVSEGQFAQVLEKELPLIREACSAASTKIMPRLTIVVSVKRHQTRFYPTTAENLPSHNNIQNGTVVDRGVTQARIWDFFLTAHSAIKGTARPAHYTVLLDEIFRPRYKENAANELEKFTHELCYLYGRATKAVSICPPAYYADIVCTRARAHRPDYSDISDTESVVTSGGASSVGGASKQIHERLRDSMYYI